MPKTTQGQDEEVSPLLQPIALGQRSWRRNVCSRLGNRLGGAPPPRRGPGTSPTADKPQPQPYAQPSTELPQTRSRIPPALGPTDSQGALHKTINLKKPRYRIEMHLVATDEAGMLPIHVPQAPSGGAQVAASGLAVAERLASS